MSGARSGPTAPAFQNGDIFVLKIHGPTGALINAVALGGSAPDRLYDMGIDGTGNATLTVLTHSADFPAAGTGLFGTRCAATGVVECPWLVKIDPYNGTLLYSFVIPGNHFDDLNWGMPILAVHASSGAAYLAVSGWIDIPIPSGAAYATRTGQALTVIAPDGSRFQAATYVPPDKEVTAMAVRPDRSLWLVGQQTAATAQPYAATVDAGLSNLTVLPVVVPVPDAVAADSTGRLYLAASSWKLDPSFPNPFTLIPTANAPLTVRCPNAGALLRLDLSGAVDFATFVPNPGLNGFVLIPGPAGVDLQSIDYESGLQIWHVNPDDTTLALPLAGCAFVPAPDGWESVYLVSGIMEMRARVPVDVPAGDQAQQVDLHTYFNWVEFFQPAKLWVAK